MLLLQVLSSNYLPPALQRLFDAYIFLIRMIESNNVRLKNSTPLARAVRYNNLCIASNLGSSSEMALIRGDE